MQCKCYVATTGTAALGGLPPLVRFTSKNGSAGMWQWNAAVKRAVTHHMARGRK